MQMKMHLPTLQTDSNRVKHLFSCFLMQSLHYNINTCMKSDGKLWAIFQSNYFIIKVI